MVQAPDPTDDAMGLDRCMLLNITDPVAEEARIQGKYTVTLPIIADQAAGEASGLRPNE